jgi:hypothetical protein
LQQALHLGFVPALHALGVDVFWITNIRAAVAISMAIVVAISNHAAVTTAHAPKRRLAAWDSLLDRIAPVVSEQEPAPPAQTFAQERRVIKHQERLKVINLKGDTEPLERVRRALEQEPGCSDRQLGRMTQMAPATAKKYREMLTRLPEQAM